MSIQKIIETVIDLKIQDAYYSKTLSDHKTLTSISKKEQINDLICAGLSLTNEEMTLLRYTVDVTIPIQMKHKGLKSYYSHSDIKKKLADCAQLFLNRFQANLSNDKGSLS